VNGVIVSMLLIGIAFLAVTIYVLNGGSVLSRVSSSGSTGALHVTATASKVYEGVGGPISKLIFTVKVTNTLSGQVTNIGNFALQESSSASCQGVGVPSVINPGDTVTFTVVCQSSANSPPPPPPPPPQFYVFAVTVAIANFNLPPGVTVSGSVQVTGSPISGVFTFSGTSLQVSRSVSVTSGTRYTETVPSTFTLTLSDSSVVTVVFDHWVTPSGSVASQTVSGVVNSDTRLVAVYVPLQSPTIYTLSVSARIDGLSLPRGATLSGSLQVTGSPISGTLTFSGSSLQTNVLSVTVSKGTQYSETVPSTIRVTLSDGSAWFLRFMYWQTPSGNVGSTTVTGTVSSNVQLIAVYGPMAGTLSADGSFAGLSGVYLSYAGAGDSMSGGLEFADGSQIPDLLVYTLTFTYTVGGRTSTVVVRAPASG